MLDSAPSFLTFESGPVRPLALTPSGGFLVAANIPDGRLEIFRIGALGGLSLRASIPVGMEPVAVAARTDREVWVVNHLSDSVSVVDLARRRVVRTLLVGDEPRDIVFAGPNRERVFITTAHRGQRRTDPALAGVPGAGDPQLTTPGTGRADVWVFDASNLGADPGGVPLAILTLFGDTPRALAASPDGATVYAAIFHSGNRTATVGGDAVCDGFDAAGACPGDGRLSPGGLPNGRLPGGVPGPSTNYAGDLAPEVGLIARYDEGSGIWRDVLGRNWNNALRFTLPDLDLFAIDAATLQESARYAHVGTTLFNVAVNPASGRVYVSNTEAQNHVRFEGSGLFGGSTVQGDLARSRITIVDPASGAVEPRHLNKHIDYALRPAPAGTQEHSLATPLEMVVSAGGETLYVAAFGSQRVGVYSTADLEDDSFDPTLVSANHIALSAGGAGGLALDETRGRLYVYTRFDNGISIVDTASRRELAHLLLYSPEPAAVVEGRPFLYDAVRTSSNGEASCASCHIFGDMDQLAWDLGNPDEAVSFNPIEVILNPDLPAEPFHPMKGPMVTQTLRGLVHSGAMHWRGDRANGFFGIHPTDTTLSFNNFLVAFPGLVGADMDIDDPDEQAMMNAFTAFALDIVMPPNPIRSLDNSLTPAQQAGLNFVAGSRRSDGQATDDERGVLGFTCGDCHRLAPGEGLFGTATSVNPPPLQPAPRPVQPLKIPQLRNLYTRVGRFGQMESAFLENNGQDFDFQGDQIRGFGIAHDGSVDTIFRLMNLNAFRHNGEVGFNGGSQQRRDVEAYILAFDSDLAPIVGQQVTAGPATWVLATPRILLLINRARAPFTSAILGGDVTECDLVAHSSLLGQPRGWLYDPLSDRFTPDRAGEAPLPIGGLRQLAVQFQTQITFTCVPPGSGRRVALDRDLDGLLNADDPLLDPMVPAGVQLP